MRLILQQIKSWRKVIKLNECLIKTRGTLGTTLFRNNTAIYVDPNLKFTKVNKVCAIQMISDDPDEKSETGHIRKIYPNQTNATMTKAN